MKGLGQNFTHINCLYALRIFLSETFNKRKVPGRKLRVHAEVCMYVCVYVCVYVCQHWVFFAYKSWTDDWIFMMFIHRVDIYETLKMTKGQGHKVKGQICYVVKNLLWPNTSWTNYWISMMLTHMISIDGLLKWNQGQGHKVKGQVQIYNFDKNTWFDYLSWTNNWILILLIHKLSIDRFLKLTQGQRHKI